MNSGEKIAAGLADVTFTVTDIPIDRIDEVTDALGDLGIDLRERFVSSSTRIVMKDSIGAVERF